MIVKLFHGFCMALADSVPGVSGGTVAFILGFYEPFLNALHGLFGKDPAARRAGFVYLAKLGVGWCLGLGVSVVVLTNLYHTETYLLSSLFLGLTAASIPLILFRERTVLAGRLGCFPLAILGAALVCVLSLLRRMSTTISGVDYLDLSVGESLYLFLAGALAITAMVLPGISGSTLLLIFGVYVPTLHALRGLLAGDLSALPGLVMLCLGVLAGVEDHVFSATSTYTNPMQAVDFFKKTGCDALAISYGTCHGANKGKDTKIRREIAIATKECMLHEGIEGYLVSHGSSTVPQEYVQGINALGGQLENAFGIDVAQLVDVAHCGINKINVDTDIRLACTRNLLELFENEPELRESASIGQLYKDLKKNPKNFDPRNYVASIMDTITLGTVPDAHVQKVVDCMKDGVTESIAPLLVQFGSYRKSHLIEVVTCEQMAERYKKAGI